jgi:hypothetical protein
MKQLLLALLVILPAMADTMTITFTATSDIESGGIPLGRSLNFSGALTTDGLCEVCTISEAVGVITAQGGLLSLSIRTPPGAVIFGLGDYSPNAASDQMSGTVTYDVATNTLSGFVANNGSEVIDLRGSTYYADIGGSVFEDGLLSVNSIPETSSWILLATCVILFAIRRYAIRA